MKNIVLVFSFLFLSSAVSAQGVTGLWKTIDDETGKPKSIVSVYKEGEMLYGKILFTYNEDGAAAVITEGKNIVCDPKKLSKIDDKPYCGLIFLKDLKQGKGGKYSGGTITDPKKGKTYRAEMWLEGGKLIVRGKLGPFGRNQTWLPVKPEDLPKGFKY